MRASVARIDAGSKFSRRGWTDIRARIVESERRGRRRVSNRGSALITDTRESGGSWRSKVELERRSSSSESGILRTRLIRRELGILLIMAGVMASKDRMLVGIQSRISGLSVNIRVSVCGFVLTIVARSKPGVAASFSTKEQDNKLFRSDSGTCNKSLIHKGTKNSIILRSSFNSCK